MAAEDDKKLSASQVGTERTVQSRGQHDTRCWQCDSIIPPSLRPCTDGFSVDLLTFADHLTDQCTICSSSAPRPGCFRHLIASEIPRVPYRYVSSKTYVNLLWFKPLRLYWPQHCKPNLAGFSGDPEAGEEYRMACGSLTC